jgi:hypothetical protein
MERYAAVLLLLLVGLAALVYRLSFVLARRVAVPLEIHAPPVPPRAPRGRRSPYA